MMDVQAAAPRIEEQRCRMIRWVLSGLGYIGAEMLHGQVGSVGTGVYSGRKCCMVRWGLSGLGYIGAENVTWSGGVCREWGT